MTKLDDSKEREVGQSGIHGVPESCQIHGIDTYCQIHGIDTHWMNLYRDSPTGFRCLGVASK
jgi:hypothetical protein